MFRSDKEPSVPLFIESICLRGRGLVNAGYHQARFAETRNRFFPGASAADLPAAVTNYLDSCGPDRAVPVSPAGRWKVRVVYGEEIEEIDVQPYVFREIRGLRLVDGGGIDYRYKYFDRTCFDRLKAAAAPDEEVLILQNGCVTDTAFSNIAFFDGKDWLTPDPCLLPGTRRRQLLDEGKVRTARIPVEMIGSFRTAAFINAMIDLGELTLPVERIRF